MKCLNIIVYYDNIDEVKKYVTDVTKMSNNNVDFAIVVNSDANNKLLLLKDTLAEAGTKNISYYDYGTNVGYMNAMLKTIQITELTGYNYYILSNTDICYEDKDFFNKLLGQEYEKDIGCIAPSVFSTHNNSYSNPNYIKRILKLKLIILTRIFKYPKIAQIYLRIASCYASLKKSEKKDSCYVYAPHGCYMIFTKQFIESISGYEYGVKLYSEEAYVGELLIKKNLKCYYDAKIEVIHQESSVLSNINYRVRFSAWKESLDYIIREFY